MSVMNKLTISHLLKNKKRTLITIIGIALSIAMVTAISGLIVSFQDMLYRETVANKGDWHVRYYALDEEVAMRVKDEDVFLKYDIENEEEGVSISLSYKKPDKSIYETSESIAEKYNIDTDYMSYNTNLLIAMGILPGAYYSALYGFAAVLLLIVAISSIIVISNAFTISADERSKQFGLLKSVGATRSQISGSVVFEAIVLAAIAVPIGIIGGLIAEQIALSLANYFINKMDLMELATRFRVVLSPIMIIIAAASALITALVAALMPALRASRVSPVDAIRQTKSIKINPRKIKVNPLISKLFGFEGTLAAKTMKRNKRKYRTTVISLVVSIVLFISVSSFGQLLARSSSMIYSDYNVNLYINVYGDDAAMQDEVYNEISSWDKVSSYPIRELSGDTEIDESLMTPMGLEIFKETFRYVNIYSIGNENLEDICNSLKIDFNDMKNISDPKAILINNSGIYINDGKRTNFTPYKVPKGEKLVVLTDSDENKEESAEFTIAGEILEVPNSLGMKFYGNSINLLVSDEVILDIWPERFSKYLSIAVFAEDANGFEENVRSYLEETVKEGGYNVSNFEAAMKNNRYMTMLIMTFIYGFVAMLSLIGITNVVTTISTNIALRKQEFAMLKSVGMTEKSMAKMLNLESLIYGFKALIIGIPIGILASYLMYKSLLDALEFKYMLPVQSIIISIVAILILNYGTMTYARRKQRQFNIVSTLREEIV